MWATRQQSNGRWVIVNPAGQDMVSIGVNHVDHDGHWSDAYDSVDAWRAATAELLETAEFNTCGSWSHDKQCGDMYQCRNLNFLNDFADLHGAAHKSRDEIMLINHPDFSAFCMQLAMEQCDAGEPSLMGYFTDNELSWSKAPEAQLKDMAHRYFEACAGAIREADPGSLVMGARFHRGETFGDEFKGLWKECGNHCDVVSVNYYGVDKPDLSQTAKWFSWTEKPYLVTEAYAMAFQGCVDGLTPSNEAGAGKKVATQADRAAWYKKFTNGCKGDLNCVGYHWFRYPDDPEKGGANKGLVGVHFTPYSTLLDQCQSTNHSWHNKVAEFAA
jgi:hypothetical protein